MIIINGTNSEAVKLTTAIIDEIRKEIGIHDYKFTLSGQGMLMDIADDVVSGELILDSGEQQRNADRIKKYGSSFDVSDGKLYYHQLADVVISAQIS